jgi:purine nucleoside permease
MNRFQLLTLALAISGLAAQSQAATQAPAPTPAIAAPATPIPIKVVVVTMFEIGADSGDQPGEFQTWVERLPLPQTIAFPQGYRNLRYNPEQGVLGIVTGIGTARSSASIMALGMDQRFDLSKAYWLVAGIAGANPDTMSAGSAAWAEWLVDGDLSHEIDAREIPKGWSTGKIPLRSAQPFQQPVPADNEGAVYHLNPGLTNWAYQLTKDTPLADDADLRQLRSRYKGYPAAQQPPKVIKGDQLAGQTFWHGKLMNAWAEKWVDYWTHGQGSFATSAMEETGTAQALTFLSKAGRADINRLLVLRTASNYTMPYPGKSAAASLAAEHEGSYSAYLPSLEAAFKVGSRVTRELSDHWNQYRDSLPTDK